MHRGAPAGRADNFKLVDTKPSMSMSASRHADAHARLKHLSRVIMYSGMQKIYRMLLISRVLNIEMVTSLRILITLTLTLQ